MSRCSTKLIHICKKTTTCIWLRSELIFSVDKYIFQFWVVFTVPFLCYFQKLQFLVAKTFWTNFCCFVLLYLCTQKVCLRFQKSYFKLEINIFVFRGAIFSRYVQLKSSFSEDKKHQRWNLEHTLVEKLSKLTWQSIKGKFHHWQRLELCKVIHSAKLQWKR